MKNALVLLLIVMCSVWLVWIKLNSVSAVESRKPTPSTTNSPASKPKNEREAYQSLAALIRVFESDLSLDHLIPINAALGTELPRLSMADRYRIYQQLQQALQAYTNRLNRQQSDLIERYTELQAQLWQQVYTQNTAQTEPSADPLNSQIIADTAPDLAAEQAAQEASDQAAQQRFDQQWPQTLQQGLSAKQQQLLEALAKQQIEVLYFGEGIYEFWLNPNYWVKQVAPHLTKADQVYLKQAAEQEQQPYAYDAGLVVSWQVLGERVQIWEQYLKNYPKSYFVDDAQRKHDAYLEYLLTGMDNTPTHEQGVLLPEVKAAYAQLIVQYPNSRLSKTLQLFEQQLADNPSDVPAVARRAMALAKDQISD